MDGLLEAHRLRQSREREVGQRGRTAGNLDVHCFASAFSFSNTDGNPAGGVKSKLSDAQEHIRLCQRSPAKGAE